MDNLSLKKAHGQYFQGVGLLIVLEDSPCQVGSTASTVQRVELMYVMYSSRLRVQVCMYVCK